jgi:hypothetical protein
MQLEIPENAQVVINIGSAPLRALTDESGTRGSARPSRRSMRPWLIVLIGAVAFGIGHMVRFGHEGSSAAAAPALAAAPSPAPTMPAGHPSPAETEIPPAFRQGLNAPPRVTPAPGKADASGRAKNSFGLEN